MNDWAGGYLGPGRGLTQISEAQEFLCLRVCCVPLLIRRLCAFG